ncbi:ABC-type dipeptide transport system, periplasmic component [Archaeoglobus sulfaticallidus PM70-1]|uniref:ABC-type dipeptide transport system, periplasmic component n=1 Tax=Archaeoglobus sulfaticallidus PM70-1 TaxID=387631 RepID=N0BLV9_9EURY|nr:ABC transporter substrate-binding protein [Archaeoglobus sulfaticallidus]AGK61240.1 ABC-type dipeptide transport system, periplasmic component [Archaeoglobus sulfaticallidus PM70-1]
MRKLLSVGFVIALILAIAISGCAGTNKTTEPSTPPSEGAKEETKKVESKPNVVIYGYVSEMTTLDPSTEFSNSIIILPNVYECLVKYTPEGLKPWLATSWESNEDGTEWIFHLRKGVKFHSGNELTAEDVKWSIERTVRMGLGASFIWDPVESIEVVDDYTIKFKLKYPANLPLIASSSYGAYIMDSKLLSKIGDDETIADYLNKGHDAGSGPYTIEKYEPKTEVVLKKFDEYWGGWSDDQFDIAIIKIVPDASLREQMVASGEIHIARDLPLDDIPKLQQDPNVVVKQKSSYQELYAMLNTRKPPLDNKLVRQALSYAVPYEDIVKYVLHDYGKAAKGPIPPGMLGYFEDLKTYTYDPEKAKELLEQAGYPNGGFKLVLTYTNGDEAEAKVAEILKAEWGKLGIDVEIRPMNWEQQWALAKSDPMKAQDVFIFYWWPTYPTPYDFLFSMFHSEDEINFNLAYYSNPEFDELIDKAVALEGTNIEKAKDLYRKAEEILMEDAPAIFLYSPDDVYVIHKSVKGFEANPGYPQVVFFYDLRAT